MAYFRKDLSNFKGSRCLHIRSVEQTEHFTLYVITVTLGAYSWTVKRRYNEFHQLHEKLATSHKLDRSLLPPKKLFGNLTDAFIKKRQRELEIYLQTIIIFLAQNIPSCLTYFLDFDKYEIHGITQAMAEDLYSRGEMLLMSRDAYELTTLQLYSLTERLKLPEPTCESGDVRKDLGHILDFITRCKHLKVVCSREPEGSSNIMMSKLSFDLTLFKSLQNLEMCGCNFRMANGLETVKQTVIKFEVHQSSSSMKEILLQDASHWRAEDGSLIIGYWNLVVELDFSSNSFSEIHESIQLMPHLEKLNLSCNLIESIQNLHWLSQLTHIDLSHNNIRQADTLHTKLGNVQCLKLSYNQLESLSGFTKLFSLQRLDVSFNKISMIGELSHVSQLPCIEELILLGNQVTSSLDYRIKTMEMFGDRLLEVVLDHKPPEQSELDTVAVLQALKKAKDIKVTKKTRLNKNASALSLSDMYSQSASSSTSDLPEDRVGTVAASSSVDVRGSTPTRLTAQHQVVEALTQQSPRSVSQGSASSVGSLDDSLGLTFTSSGSARPLLAESVTPGLDQTGKHSSSRDEINDTCPAETVPQAHPFDLIPGKSSSVSPSSSYPASSTPGNRERNMSMMFNVADLPSNFDQSFLLWLNKHLFTSADLDSNHRDKDSIVDILWCYAELMSQPLSIFPCCTILTKKKLFIETLTGLESTFPGVPELKPRNMVSLQNIQQLVLGPCHAFLRLEEAFVGKSGVFTLFAIEPQSLKKFFNKLFSACCNLDVINGYSFMDLTVHSDLLKNISCREEMTLGSSSDRLVAAALAQLQTSQSFCFLVLSEKRVYCLDLSCVHWPPPSYETSQEAAMRMVVYHEFCVGDQIGSIRISSLDSHTCDSDTGKGAQLSPDAHLTHFFTQFILSIEVTIPKDERAQFLRTKEYSGIKDCSEASHFEIVSDCSQGWVVTLSYLFPSATSRDLFLDRLNNMRTELAHRMSPRLREEPEGGNELTSAPDGMTFQPMTSSVTSAGLHSRSLSGSSLDSTEKQAEAVEYSKVNSNIQQDVGDRYEGCIRSLENVTVSKNNITSVKIGDHILAENVYATDPSTSELQNSLVSNLTSSVSKLANFCNLQDMSEDDMAVRVAQQMKAGSLPLNFDWKPFYLKSALYSTHDSTSRRWQDIEKVSQQETTNVASGENQAHHPSSDITTHFLEDIESSSELDQEMSAETEQDSFLTELVKSYDLMQPLSSRLKPFSLMKGRELRKFFKSVVAQHYHPHSSDRSTEQLHYLLWCMVVPYSNPKVEITTLVMVSTHGIYLVSDTSPQMAHKSRPSWMTHSRNRSDSAISVKPGVSDTSQKIVGPYFIFNYKDLLQVNIGLFDQCIRLTGSNENSVFTLATRDSAATESFIEKLNHVLSTVAVSPVLEISRAEIELDFYQVNPQPLKSELDEFVYTHPSKVKFVYPGEDAVRDILYLVHERVSRGIKAVSTRDSISKLWFYLQCYLLPSGDGGAVSRAQPRSVIITTTFFCLSEEDIVTYPLPDFVRGVPENPCHEIVECRRIDSLKRITLLHGQPHLVCLTFQEEVDTFEVDVSVQHFSQMTQGRDRQNICPEVTLRLHVHSLHEREKLVQVLDKSWKGLVTQIGRILDIRKI